MPAINFQKRFADKVESGEKRQTIRAYRKNGKNPKRGDTLYLYSGMRTKFCYKLKEVTCKEIHDIIINNETIYLNSLQLSESAKVTVAISDGFKNCNDFIEFFKKTHGLPFYGLLITW